MYPFRYVKESQHKHHQTSEYNVNGNKYVSVCEQLSILAIELLIKMGLNWFPLLIPNITVMDSHTKVPEWKRTSFIIRIFLILVLLLLRFP